VTVRQGDTVKLTAFVVNGDEHHVRVNDPDGREVIAETKWNRGREYQLSFVAKKLGTYHDLFGPRADYGRKYPCPAEKVIG